MKTKRSRFFPNFRSRRVRESYAELTANRASLRLKFLYIFIAVLVCSVFFSFHIFKKPGERNDYPSEVGLVWPGQTLESDITYPIYKNDDEYKRDVEEARRASLPVFILDNLAFERAKSRIETIIDAYTDSTESAKKTLTPVISDKSLKRSFQSNSDQKKKILLKLKSVLIQYLENIYKKGFIDIPKEFIKKTEVTVRISDNTEYISYSGDFIDSLLFSEKITEYITNQTGKIASNITQEIISKIQFPNLHFSPELTKNAEELAVKSVAMTEGFIRKNEIIVEKGQTINDRISKKIKSYEKSRFIRSDTNFTLWMFCGSFGHALIIFSILIIYLFFIRKRIFYDNQQVVLLLVIVFLASLFAWISMQVSSRLPVEYFILLPGLSMLAAIVFDSRTAFYVTVTMALMVSGIRGNDYDTGTSMMFAGTLAAYTVRDIQSRTQIFQSMFFIFLGFLIPIVSFGLERGSDFMQIIYKLIATLLNSAISPLMTFGLLLIIERITKITTDLKLEEYDNLNHPLLLKMGEMAPGTYQHTMSLATLAQKCALAIGANALLVKVGVLFHDIGKITKPEYFAENQLDLDNKHDQLSPRKSAESIRNHIIEGQKLANEWKLPERISEFIPMHHGTSLIRHFYAKAVEEAPEGEEIDESDYRYFGPKPNSKETALVMICDSSEALSRIASTDKELLEINIERLIQDKLNDGQFNECDLTFKELQIIKDTCIKSLFGAAHQRHKYKEIPIEQNRDNLEINKFSDEKLIDGTE